jgi:hypothetical protein
MPFSQGLCQVVKVGGGGGGDTLVVLVNFCEFVFKKIKIKSFALIVIYPYGRLSSSTWNYLTLRSGSWLNNPQNSEIKFCEKYEVDMLKNHYN